MKIFALTVVCLAQSFFASAGFAQDKPESTPVDGKIVWVFDYEEGKRLADKEDKPMFVVFRCER